MADKYAFIDEILGKTPYLMGNEFSIADAYLYNVTRWASYDAIKLDLSGFKNLQAFMQRMNQRPSVQASLQAEGIA
jgi:glutathione S-transferase